jgi:hypothetical protein
VAEAAFDLVLSAFRDDLAVFARPPTVSPAIFLGGFLYHWTATSCSLGGLWKREENQGGDI